MAEYRYRSLDGGTIELPSGPWRWFPSRLVALPEGICVMQRLVFGHMDVPGSTMHLRIDPSIEDLSAELVSELALRPDERSVVVGGHEYRVQPPAYDAAEPMWRVSGPNQRRWKTDWEIDVPLGVLTEADMNVIVRPGP